MGRQLFCQSTKQMLIGKNPLLIRHLIIYEEQFIYFLESDIQRCLFYADIYRDWYNEFNNSIIDKL